MEDSQPKFKSPPANVFFLKKKKTQQQYEENISNKWTHNLNRNSLNFQLEKMK